MKNIFLFPPFQNPPDQIKIIIGYGKKITAHFRFTDKKYQYYKAGDQVADTGGNAGAGFKIRRDEYNEKDQRYHQSST